ncbi:MAG: TonB family protein, partial [Bryobacteraceae bacterium]
GNSLSYLWQVAGKPLAVSLALDLIDRLEREIVENFRSLTSRGSETGGLLLGHIGSGAVAGVPTIVSVDDYETIPCDYSRGPLYRLSDADQGRFERAIEQHLASGAGVVGFFRGHTRKGISLDADDLAFIETRFARPSDIVLLVRPFATKASVGGIFIWEDGRMQADASHLEFPFRSAQLAESARILETPRIAAPMPPPAAALAPVAKPAARAQIVPIATRREFTVPAVVPASPEPPKPEPPAPVSAKPAEGKTPEAKIVPPKPAEAKPPVELEIPPAEAEARPATPAESAAPKPEPEPAKPAEAVPAAKPSVTFLAETEPASSRSPLPLVLSAASAVVLGFALFVYPGFLTHSRRPSVPQSGSTQILRVERTGTDLLLTWNRDSEAIRNATHAVLTINDGDRQENYSMDPSQLSSGSIVYSPISADTSFRMELTERDQTKTTTESVRVLRTRPSPMDAANPPAAQKAVAPAAVPPTPGATEVPPASPAASSPTDPSIPEPQPTVPPTPAKKFDASSLVTRLRPARESDVPDAPAINAPAAGIPGAGLSAAAPAPFPASSTPPRPDPPAASSTAVSNQTGGQIREAMVVYKKAPEYPQIARQMGAKGEVVLTATVGIDGRVKSVKVVQGHPLLVQAATDAVMQWVYRPTLLNGQAVQNEVRITLNFEGR